MMNDFRFYSKDFLLGFIDVYKNLPSLWQVKNPEYHNRDKKNKDYDVIIKKMKEIEPRADRNSVANKISNLRSVYKRECKRLLKENPNKKPEELVSSNIWYFHYLHFLQEQQKPASPPENIATISEETTTAEQNKEQVQSQEAKITKKRTSEAAIDEEPAAKLAKSQSLSLNTESVIKLEEKQSEQPLNSITTDFIKESEILLPEFVLKTEPEEPPVEVDKEENENYDLVSEIGASTFSSDHAHSDRANSERPHHFDLMERNNFDRFDHMTSAWAGILRNLPRSQQIFAEKLINDVMFEAQMENLSRQSIFLATSNSQKEKLNGFAE